jgi:hypothetical protein
MLDLISLKFDDLDSNEMGEMPQVIMPTISGLTPKRRGVLCLNRGMIVKWLDRVHDETIVELMNGYENPFVKVVSGRAGKRNHKDESASELWLQSRISVDKLFTKRLISVAQVEKVLGKGVFPKSLVEQGDPKPALVPIEDERSAIVPLDSKFDNEPDETEL